MYNYPFKKNLSSLPHQTYSGVCSDRELNFIGGSGEGGGGQPALSIQRHKFSFRRNFNEIDVRETINTFSMFKCLLYKDM